MKKKIFALIAAGLMFSFGSLAIAGGPNHDSGNAIGIGGFAIDAGAVGGAIDCDVKTIPNGIAGGISASGGVAGAQAAGGILNGSVGGDVSATGGGLTSTDAYRWNPHVGDKSIGVGSASRNIAVTGASIHVNVDPAGKYVCDAMGAAGGHIGGIAGQITLNGSTLTESPRYFDSTGRTLGIAGQGSVGGFVGGAEVGSLGDLNCRCWTIDSYAGAGAGANITMSGGSYSDSYRFVDWHNGMKTEGMGTYVGANTDVTATGFSYDYDNGLADANAYVYGGYVAAGGAVTKTVQMAPDCSGVAKATAAGFYAGAGSLNSSYSGSANGYSRTSVTTMSGMKGSINSAASGMQVKSIGSSLSQQGPQ